MSVRDVKREYLEVPLGLVDEPQLPSRAAMDEQKLDELTADIRANGVLQPVSLARASDRFEVVAGHRRTLAAKRAGLVAIPALVYPSVEKALEAVKFAENRYREDLNPADEAIWFAELLERDCAGDVDVLCAQLNIKRAYAENRLVLLRGDAEVFDAVQRGKIAVGIAQQLNRCTNPVWRRYLLKQAIDGGATVAVVTGWISDWKRDQEVLAGLPVTTAAPVAAVPVAEQNYFRCIVCRGTEDIAAMQPFNVHHYCKKATLDKALDMFENRAGLVVYPRTRDEAIALITELDERFGLSAS